jgi:hypothetical protein
MKATGKIEKKATVTLELTQVEAAYLHAFLGHFSPDDFRHTVKEVARHHSDGCFLPAGFDVDEFDPKFRKETGGFYFTLDSVLQDIKDA